MSDRVRVPGTAIRVKNHKALAACARYLAENQPCKTNDILYGATYRNGKPIINSLKSGAKTLVSILGAHPHFSKIKEKGWENNGVEWELKDSDTYLLGPGQALPLEFYDYNPTTGRYTEKVQ